MILTDSSLDELVRSEQVLEDYDPSLIKYCGCELRLGRVFMPGSGEAQGGVAPQRQGVRGWIANLIGEVSAPTVPTVWTIGPSETMVVITRETVRIPNGFCATYGQLNRLANHGLMLLNTSIVEPGYHGPLSCVLVNFSSQKVLLRQDQSIAKISFHRLDGPSHHLQKSFDRVSYESGLAETATKLPKSFLDISGIEQRITERVDDAVKRRIVLAGIVIGMLLLWSQLEGVLSTWVWKRTGFVDSSKQIELSYIQQQIKTDQTLIDLKGANQKLEDTVQRLTRTVEELKATPSRTAR